MSNKNQKQTDLRSSNQSQKENPGAAKNRNAETPERNKKDSKRNKSEGYSDNARD